MRSITNEKFVNLDNDDLLVMAHEYNDSRTDVDISRSAVFAEMFNRGMHTESDISPKSFWTDARSDKYGDSHPFLGEALFTLVSLTPTATLTEHIVLSGASKATVARVRSRANVTDPDKSDAITQGLADAGITGESDKQDKSDTTDKSQEFDLAALLSALDDTELSAVLSTVGLDRVRKLVAA
jgi:hypothetical protein